MCKRVEAEHTKRKDTLKAACMLDNTHLQMKQLGKLASYKHKQHKIECGLTK